LPSVFNSWVMRPCLPSASTRIASSASSGRIGDGGEQQGLTHLFEFVAHSSSVGPIGRADGASSAPLRYRARRSGWGGRDQSFVTNRVRSDRPRPKNPIRPQWTEKRNDFLSSVVLGPGRNGPTCRSRQP
jgi:hypothetical protein